jgi:hypothetical protein
VAQVDPFDSNILKPGFPFLGSRFETRWFQAVCQLVGPAVGQVMVPGGCKSPQRVIQLDSTCTGFNQPHHVALAGFGPLGLDHRGVGARGGELDEIPSREGHTGREGGCRF